MAKVEVKNLLDGGVHFGHLTRKWDPNMAPYIYMERNGIHIINLYKTAAKLEEASHALAKIAVSGRKILFVATKKQAKDIVSEKAGNVNMPYITERWPGGMLTNFVTIRKAVKKMASIDRMKKDGTFMTLSKKERLQVDRLRTKLEKNLGSISDMTRLPSLFLCVEPYDMKYCFTLLLLLFAVIFKSEAQNNLTHLSPTPIDSISTSIFSKALESGYIDTRYFNFDLRYLIKYNQYEGFRTGFGGVTNSNVSDVIKFDGYVVYGFLDEAFKFRIGSSFNINKKSNTWLSFNYTDDLQEIGSSKFITDQRFFQLFEPRLLNIESFLQTHN
ncbi:30S ribosomal protein S2 [Flavobacteriaceae bacterium]|nr:30S ribosomal protein S2 [Flavobacteriaceae bacterium]